MVSVQEKTIEGNVYYYLEHSYREGGTVKKKSRYLGTKVPDDVMEQKQELLRELYQERWYPLFDEIQERYADEQTSMPPSLREKKREQFAIEFTYNTDRIEGSTLTRRETADLLEKGITPSRRPVEDVKEAEEHREVFYDMLAYDDDLSLQTARDWHRRLFRETKEDIAGDIREHPVGISGSTYEPPGPEELDGLLYEFFAWYQENNETMHPVHLAALVHLKFVTIHPFADGNGRISRLLMNHVLHRHGYPMLVIDYQERRSYYNALERSQVNEEEHMFVEWFFRRYRNEHQRYLD
jgi:Fic family protein